MLGILYLTLAMLFIIYLGLWAAVLKLQEDITHSEIQVLIIRSAGRNSFASVTLCQLHSQAAIILVLNSVLLLHSAILIMKLETVQDKVGRKLLGAIITGETVCGEMGRKKKKKIEDLEMDGDSGSLVKRE